MESQNGLESANEASDVNLTSFQSSNFDVAHLVEGLMEEDVRRAKAGGGGECCAGCAGLAGSVGRRPRAGGAAVVARVFELGAAGELSTELRLAGFSLFSSKEPQGRLSNASLISISLSHAAFDPQPHIRTLEQALSLLLPLRKANAAKTAELERAVSTAERTYRGDVRGAKAEFEVRRGAEEGGGGGS